MRKMDLLKGVLYALLLGLAACTSDELTLAEASRQVKVSLHVSTAVLNMEADTRTPTPMPPDYENPIYHLWVLQYDREGILVGGHQEIKFASGQLNATLDGITLRTGVNSTICVIGNWEDGTPGSGWPNSLTELKELTIDMEWLAKRGQAGIVDKPVCLFGYYEGDITVDNQTVNVVLGRLVCRLNIAVSAQTANVFSNVKVQLQKAQTSSYLFPTNLYLAPADYSDASLCPYPEETLTSGALGTTPIYRYYYMAENVMTGTAPTPQHTQLKITATRGGIEYVKTIDLGRSDINDYSLLRNNNYTFNIVLK